MSRGRPIAEDLTGQAFSRLTVVEYVGDRRWRCRCVCGKEVFPDGSSLRKGKTKSCGCQRRDDTIARNRTADRAGRKNGRFLHGLHGTPEYTIWKGLKQRCSNPRLKAYANYGGRGVCVCERWRLSFDAFLEDMGSRPSPQHEIDRIDNDGNYEPSNCRWVKRAVNSRNKRTNLMLTFNGKTQCLTDWAKELGISIQTLSSRLNQSGWTVQQTLSIQPIKRSR